jgi:hypothetical protein
MSGGTQPIGGSSPQEDQDKGGAASDSAARKRPTLAPMPSSTTTAPMRTRPPMTPLPPLAPKPPPPPEPELTVAKKPRRRVGLWLALFAVLAAGAAGAYYQFLR